MSQGSDAVAELARRSAAIVVAAGTSRRLGGRDKILASLGGRPVLWYSVQALAAAGVARIVIVAATPLQESVRQLVSTQAWPNVVAVVAGGARRQDSVSAGLKEAAPADWILVHDGARPLITADLIRRGLALAAEHGSAVAAVPVKDTIKRANAAGQVIETPPRASLWAVQTPQIFRAEILRQAHATISHDVTDDATMVEAIGRPVFLFEASYENLKITTPEDFLLAEAILRGRAACV